MKIIFALIFTFAFSICASAQQTDLQKLIDTEKSFAATSGAKGIKPAFLAYLADNAVVFAPNAVSGKEFWRARPDNSTATLSWYPVFADVAAGGIFGYTTGRGEYRPKGAGDAQVLYSDFATVWERQPDGNYRAVLDIGVSHDKPLSDDRTVSSPAQEQKFSGEHKPPASSFVNSFYDTATTKGLKKAYKNFAGNDARFLREGRQPVLGKTGAPVEPKKNKISFGKQMTLESAGDFAYSVTTYQLKDDAGKVTKRGNSVQFWKLRADDKWQIVLDVMDEVSDK